MKLRNAKPDDFDVFKIMYQNSSLQWLYESDYSSSSNVDISTPDIYPEVFDYIEEQYQSYNKKNFERDLKIYKIFIIEDVYGVVGYVTIINLPDGTIKVCEWAIMKESEVEKVIRETIKVLQQKFPNKVFTVHATKHKIVTLKKFGLNVKEDSF